MICEHPQECIETSDEGTSYCRMCALEARVEKAESNLEELVRRVLSADACRRRAENMTGKNQSIPSSQLRSILSFAARVDNEMAGVDLERSD